MKINFKRYSLYLIRWQLSTPILSIVMIALVMLNKWVAAMIANFVGGLIFYWIDQFIFVSRSLSVQWEIKDNINCSDCNSLSRGYRLVKTSNYDRIKDKKPQFRCEHCSSLKTIELRKQGIEVPDYGKDEEKNQP